VLAAILVVIFSTSDSAVEGHHFEGEDVEYMPKPAQYSQLQDAVKRLLIHCRN
jgi:DNA-binding LytR/AlgR family response regulator